MIYRFNRFEYNTLDYESALNWIKRNGHSDKLKLLSSLDGWSVIDLANRLYFREFDDAKEII